MLIILRYVLSYEVLQVLQRYVDFLTVQMVPLQNSTVFLCAESTVVVPLLGVISVGISNCSGILKVVTPFLLS